MTPFTQTDFTGGMDYLSKETSIAPNAYKLLVNARNRFGTLQPIVKSLNVTESLDGLKMQGIYSVGSVLVAFASGKAYYSTYTTGAANWVQIQNFLMDQNVDFIYTQLVTGSVNDYQRLPALNSSGSANPSGPISTSNAFNIAGTPSGLVCQDGINQPWLIAYDGNTNTVTARVTHTYAQWANVSTTSNDREYVPIGTLMYFDGVRLYIVAQDGFTIYRSVSGRPLDFMINIDKDGNKLATEDLGGARTTSFAINFETITAIQEGASGQFLVPTPRFIFGMFADYTQPTIFGEPQFSRAFTIASGVVNQDSLVDISGDTGFISFGGIKNFNAIKQSKIENTNENFSLQVSKLFRDAKNQPIIQSGTAATQFDNFNLFSVKTIFGDCVVVYDNLVSQWVGIDLNEVTAQGIKQFAIVSSASSSQLFAITKRNKVYRLYANVALEREQALLETRAFSGKAYTTYGNAYDDVQVEHKTLVLYTQFKQGLLEGGVAVKEYADDENGQWLNQDLEVTNCGMDFPMEFPIGFDNKTTIRTIPWTLSNGSTADRLWFAILWDTDYSLEAIQLNTTMKKDMVSTKEQQRILTN